MHQIRFRDGITLLSIVLMVHLFSADARSEEGGFESLSLMISVDSTQSIKGAPVHLTVVLTNPTARIITGNKQLSQDSFLILRMRGPDGQEQRLQNYRDQSFRPGPLPERIRPGEVVRERIVIPSKHLSNNGQYRLSAELQDWDRKTALHSESANFDIIDLPKEEQEAFAFLQKHSLLQHLSLDSEPRELTTVDLEHMEEFLISGFKQSRFFPFIQAKLGWLLIQQHLGSPSSNGKFLRGVQMIQKSAGTAAYQEAPLALMKLGKAYEMKSEFAKAEETYRAIITQWRQSPFAADAERRIEGIKSRR
jgi:hypothetical protein